MSYSCAACASAFEVYPGPECPKCQTYGVALGSLEENDGDAHPLGDDPSPLTRRSTGIDYLDDLLGGGCVGEFVHLLSGAPGSGKSTLLWKLASLSPACVVFSPEQTKSLVRARALECGLDARHVLYHHDAELACIERVIVKERPRDVVIDSLDHVYEGRTGAPAGSGWMQTQAMKRLAKLAHAMGIAFWIVSPVNAKGGAKGPTSVVHECDVYLKIGSPKGTSAPKNMRVLEYPRPYKNRGGPTVGMVQLAIGERGLTAWEDEAREASPETPGSVAAAPPPAE